MTTIGTINVMGEDYPRRICDNCEREMDGLQHFHWESKNFDLCINCIEVLYRNFFERSNAGERERNTYKKIPIPNDIRWNIWQRDNFTCQYCGRRENLSVDHIYPESRGGATTENNLATACRKCNSIKGSRTPEEAQMKLDADPRN